MKWELVHPHATADMLGYIPSFLSERDERSAREQLDANYPFGGFQPLEGFTMLPNGNLSYPGDPPTQLLAQAKLRNETVRFYQHAWVAVVQEDGSFVVARMD